MLLTDDPISDDGEDWLGFNAHATSLMEKIDSMEGPLTTGVYGCWGCGKSSFLELIGRLLESKEKGGNWGGDEKEKQGIFVKFNAWQYEREEHPIVPLIGTIVNGIENSGICSKKLKKLCDTLKMVASGVSCKISSELPWIGKTSLTISPAKMIRYREELRSQAIASKSEYFQFYESLQEAVKNLPVKFFVLVDDLDRCTPEKAFGLLEGIKLVLSQEQFFFFLAVNREIVEEYLTNRFRKEYGLRKFFMEGYLDKIVQLSTYVEKLLPQADFTKYTKNQIDAINAIDDSIKEKLRLFKKYLKEEDKIDLINRACSNNPRTIKRFINSLILQHF